MLGLYETRQLGAAGLLKDLTPQATSDKSYNCGDLVPAVRNGLSASGKRYASPFYAESSFLMYRKDVLAKAGVKMPLHPTWQQVATIAKKINTPSRAGICLRGKPGWGDLGAAFTTVLNTFGGTWWSAKPDGSPDKAQVDQPAFKSALDFYAGLVQKAGEKEIAGIRERADTELELVAIRAAFAAVPSLPSNTCLTVNVSPGTVIGSTFQKLIKKTDGRRIVVEVTEHAPIADYERMNEAVQRFTELRQVDPRQVLSRQAQLETRARIVVALSDQIAIGHEITLGPVGGAMMQRRSAADAISEAVGMPRVPPLPLARRPA